MLRLSGKIVATGLAVLVAFFVCANAARADTIGNVMADYAVTSADNTSFKINNTSAFNLTNVSITGTLQGATLFGTSNSVTGSSTINIGTILAGGTATYSFSGTLAFQSDFDDTYGGSASYVLSGDWNGSAITATWSPQSNKTGGFVGFLGNNSGGGESDATIASIVVSDIATTAPLPSTAWAGMGILAILAGAKCVQLRRARLVA
jgi:hypothetical protein